MAVARRSASDIWALIQHVDLVHAPFYFLAHALFGADVSTTDVRWISVVAAALTAPLLAALTCRVVAADALLTGRDDLTPNLARLTGLTAAGLWIVTPFVSRYAQEARPYAVVALLVTASTYALVRAASARPGTGRGWWVVFGVSMPLVISMNTIALLVGLAHVTWLLLVHRDRWKPAFAAATLGGLSGLPLLWLQMQQRGQVAFLQAPGPELLTGHIDFALGSGVAVALAAAAVLLSPLLRSRGLVLLGLFWGAVPVPLLWALSQLHPFWTTRYLVFVAPGTCLLLAALVTLILPTRRPIHRRLARAGIAVLTVATVGIGGLHLQGVFRDPARGHGEDLRGAAEYVAENARPGDGILFLPDGDYRYRVVLQVYPEAFRNVRDLALAADPVSSATLVGVETTPAAMPAAMRGVQRVWVVGGHSPFVTAGPTDEVKARLLSTQYRLVSDEELRVFSVRLYEAR